jgi:ubiquinone/menaquinone biosynthesis C-methylase UbiE
MMSTFGKMEDYIHGFSTREQDRLIRQAVVLADEVFRGLDFSDANSVLEIGCAVGAELQILGRRWPHLVLTGLDISRSHLSAARRLHAAEIGAGRVHLVEGDAGSLSFPNASFDRVITIWTLEHIGDPAAVVAECLRVLKPSGQLICTEVDNATFCFTPVNSVIADWWNHFNRYQQQAGGDPRVGPKLAAIVRDLGARDITEETLPVISSRNEPGRREELLVYLEDLLASGAAQLGKTGQDEGNLHRAFQAVRADPSIDFQYHAIRLTCRPPSAGSE